MELNLSIKQKVIELFNNDVDIENLEIELSLETCPLYDEYREIFAIQQIGVHLPIGHEKFPIVNLLGTYWIFRSY